MHLSMLASLLHLFQHAFSSSVRPRPVGIFVHELHEPCAGHASQGRRRQRIRLGVVVDIDVQPIHHVEMRIGEEPLHRSIANIGGNRARHERREVRIGCKGSHVVQGQPRRGTLAWRRRQLKSHCWCLRWQGLAAGIFAASNSEVVRCRVFSKGIRFHLDLVLHISRTRLCLAPGPPVPKAVLIWLIQAPSPDPP